MFTRLFETLAFFRAFLVDIARFLIPVTIPVILLETYLSFRIVEANSQGVINALPFTISFLYRPVYTGGLIWLISQSAGGQGWTTAECLIKGLKFWKDLLFVYLISSVLIFAGLLAFVLPGLVFFARLSLAEFGVVLEGMGPKEALIRSNERVRGMTLEIIVCTLALSFLLISLDIISGYFMGKYSLHGYLSSVFVSVVFMVLSSTVTILFYRFYDLALKKGEGDGEGAEGQD
ncbi:MAG: hypothetical protein PVG49_13695 [Desulfobacteraceae bacterium]|jgi:hypothetical protein